MKDKKDCEILKFKELPQGSIVVDKRSKKYFEEEFYIPLKTVSLKVFDEDKRKKINLGTIPCLKCNSNNTNEYHNCFYCFNCKYNQIYNLTLDKFTLVFINGYLAKKNKDSNKIYFFHRELMKYLLNQTSRKEKIDWTNVQIHHINEDRTDNRILNLEIVSEEEHKQIHEERYKTKAYETWIEKTYGGFDGVPRYEEFEEWLAQKEEGKYGIC